MKDHSSGVKEENAVTSEFWKSFQEVLRTGGVPEDRIRWYQNWAVQFAEAGKGRPLRNRSRQDVCRYLAWLQSQPKVQPWQVKQASDALRFLFADLLHLPWATPWPQMETFEASGESGTVQSSGAETGFPADTPPSAFSPEIEKILAQFRTELRLLHYSIRTEQTYLSWTRRFVAFHRLRHPQELGAAEVKRYLEYLAEEREVSANTQKQALCRG